MTAIPQIALAGCVALLSVACHAQELRPKYGPIDYSLSFGVVAGRTLDYTSTEQCLRHRWCKEDELPNSLVRSKVGFAAFEAGAAAVSLATQYYETRHKHRKLARALQSVDVSLLFATSAHNYSIGEKR